VLAKDDAQGSDPLRVEVTAQQFFWSYRYPEFGNKESDILRLPVNRSIVLRMTSKDVIHSFWVPEFRQKSDVVPGIQTTLHITPNKVGTYPVICTELCGLGHALMRSRTIVMTDEAFQTWAAQKGGA
jgi:cytochrome c oxidase subunit II